MLTQTLDLGDRSYNIHIGSGTINLLTKIIRDFNPKQSKIIIITEKTVADLYLQNITQTLEKNYTVVSIILSPGEETKSFDNYIKVMNFCLDHQVERTHMIIALGGGVIGDLVGFVASTLKRGCRFIQIPTTLLSQVDSSVGGKTAINVSHGKNLVGAFYQPCSVIIDIDFIQTLPERVYRSGYAEVIKYGLLGDKSFFDYLADHVHLFIKKDQDFLLKIVSRSIEMKAQIVSRDETEQGERALLNLGHTFGHAYEAETGYSDVLHHGEAVALGMYHAALYSEYKSILTSKECGRIYSLLKDVGFILDIRHYIPNFDAEVILHHMMQDKKTKDNQIFLILLLKLGDAFISKQNKEDIIYFLSNNLYKNFILFNK